MSLQPLDTQQPFQVTVCDPDTLGLALTSMLCVDQIRAAQPRVMVRGVIPAGRFTDLAPPTQYDSCCWIPSSWSGRWGAWCGLRATPCDLLIAAAADRHSRLVATALPTARRLHLSSRRGANRVSCSTMPSAPFAGRRLLQKWGFQTQRGLQRPGVSQQVQAVRRKLHMNCRFAIIHVDEGLSPSGWSSQQLGRVSRYLGQWIQLPTLAVWRSKPGRERAQNAIASSGGHAVLAPAMGLREIAGLLQAAEFVLSTDVDLLDVADELGTRTLTPYANQTGLRDRGEPGSQADPQEVALLATHLLEQGNARQAA